VDQPDWISAEALLFDQSMGVIRQFAMSHPSELFSTFAFAVDSEYAGVALNFDTLENSLSEAQRHERHEIEHRNRLFGSDRSWENARYFVSHHTNRIDDCNLRGPFKYELVAFVELAAWEKYFNGSEDCPEMDGRIIASLWRVVDRLVSSKAFDGLRLANCFRIAFSFHDNEMIVLRVLNWPAA
jgi:hypothetical protein